MALKIKTKAGAAPDPSTDKDEHMKRYAKFYGSGVLDYDTHSRMVPNLEFYATQAGIPPHYIYTSSKGLLTELDLKYLHRWGVLDERAISGAYFTENSERYIERMYALVATVLRNLIDARFITLQELVKALKHGEPVDSKLVCIPNFCLPKKGGGDVATWELSSVVGWLLQRQGIGYQTVVFVEDTKYIETQYGAVIKDLFSNHMSPLK